MHIAIFMDYGRHNIEERDCNEIIKYRDYPLNLVEGEEFRNPLRRQREIDPDTFRKAVYTLCYDQNCKEEFKLLIDYLEDDKEYLDIAKEVMADELVNMITQANRISVALKKVI